MSKFKIGDKVVFVKEGDIGLVNMAEYGHTTEKGLVFEIERIDGNTVRGKGEERFIADIRFELAPTPEGAENILKARIAELEKSENILMFQLGQVMGELSGKQDRIHELEALVKLYKDNPVTVIIK